MNRYVNLTIAVIVAVSFGLAAYDVWVDATAGGGATISWIIWTAAQRWPTIPFGFGYLMGHFFGQMRKA